MPAQRPPHVITPAEVDDWLADSANKAVTYHRTSREAARAIVERGVDVTKSRIGSYGQGFYTATDPDAFHGEVTLSVAVRAIRPLAGDDLIVGDVVDRLAVRFGGRLGLITPSVAAMIRRELRRMAYDAIIVEDGGGDGVDYVIALVDDAVRVVAS